MHIIAKNISADHFMMILTLYFSYVYFENTLISSLNVLLFNLIKLSLLASAIAYLLFIITHIKNEC